MYVEEAREGGPGRQWTKGTLTELQTTASIQNHQPAPNTAPATPGPNIAQSSAKSIELLCFVTLPASTKLSIQLRSLSLFLVLFSFYVYSFKALFIFIFILLELSNIILINKHLNAHAIYFNECYVFLNFLMVLIHFY